MKKQDRIKAPCLPKITELRDVKRLWEGISEERAEGIRLRDAVIEAPVSLTFAECELDHVTLSGNARGCRFEDVIFRHCDCSGAVFDESSFTRCLFQNCRLLGTSLIRVSLNDVTVSDSVFDYSNFSGSSWKNVSLADSRFREAALAMIPMKQVSVSCCDFAEAEFTDTKLAGLDFSDSSINGIMVKPEDLKGVRVNRDQAVVFARLLGLDIAES